MKNVLKIFGVFCFAVLAFACSKDDDPANNDLFVGTYKGAISFNDNSTSISEDDGSVTVVKTGDKYYFRFSDGIKDLTGVEFEKDGDNVLINIDFQEGIQYIRINASTLKMNYTKDGQTWTANCTR